MANDSLKYQAGTPGRHPPRPHARDNNNEREDKGREYAKFFSVALSFRLTTREPRPLCLALLLPWTARQASLNAVPDAQPPRRRRLSKVRASAAVEQSRRRATNPYPDEETESLHKRVPEARSHPLDVRDRLVDAKHRRHRSRPRPSVENKRPPVLFAICPRPPTRRSVASTRPPPPPLPPRGSSEEGRHEKAPAGQV